MVKVQKGKTILYVIQCIDLFKVGITTDIRARIKTMELSNPHPLDLVLFRYVPKQRVRLIEMAVHAGLKDFALGREWFNASLEQIRAVVDVTVAADKDKFGWHSVMDSTSYKNSADLILANGSHSELEAPRQVYEI